MTAPIEPMMLTAEDIKGDRVVWLKAYADVEEALRSNDFDRGLIEREDSLRWQALTHVDGSPHTQRRRIYGRLFTRERLEEWDRLVHRGCLDELRHFQSEAARSGDEFVRFDLIPMVRRILVRLAVALVGIDGVQTQEEVERLRILSQQITSRSLLTWARGDPQELIDEAHETKRRFAQDYFDRSWSRRASELDSGALSDKNQDLLTILLSNEGLFEGLDKEIFLREAMLFFSGTGSTVPLLTPHVVVELEELERRGQASRDQFTDPGFLREAIVESLRLHPSGQLPLKRANTEVELPSGRRLAAGQVCVLDIPAANRDPSVFSEDASEFRLSRAFPKRSPVGLAFGGGSHLCIGIWLSLGRGEISGAMVTILRTLYRAGMTTDPDDPPERIGPVVDDARAHAVHNYRSFPVRLSRRLVNAEFAGQQA